MTHIDLKYRLATSEEYSELPFVFDKGAWMPCDGAYDVFDRVYAKGYTEAHREAVMQAWDDAAASTIGTLILDGGEIPHIIDGDTYIFTL